MSNLEERISKLTPNQRKLLNLKMKEQELNKEKSKILLPLQEGNISNKRPLFFLHPLLGVTGYFINVVRHLDPEQPVYGIQSPAFYNIRPPFDDMTEMANYYLDAVRSIQSEPPYIFIGHSSGSLIAYEMALQLNDHQNEIPYLIFIDQAAPLGLVEDKLMDAFKDPNLFESDQAMFLTVWLVSLAHNQELTFSIEDLMSLSSLDEKYELVANFLKQAGFITENASRDIVKTILQMIANHAVADTKYHEKFTSHEPNKKYEGRTILLRCTKETVWQGYDFVSPVDTSEYSNWEKFCSGPIDVIGIPKSDHISIIMEPCVKDIATSLQPYLDRVTPVS